MARRATIGTGVTFAGQPDARTVVHAGRYGNAYPFLDAHPLLSAACVTWICDDLAFSLAPWTGDDVDKRAEDG
jgi:hypothetical protein